MNVLVTIVAVTLVLGEDTRWDDQAEDLTLPVKRQQLHNKEREKFCRTVCSYCRNVLIMRWAALCFVQCEQGGRAYDACLTIWSIRSELERAIHKPDALTL